MYPILIQEIKLKGLKKWVLLLILTWLVFFCLSAQPVLPPDLSPWEVEQLSPIPTEFPNEALFLDNFAIGPPSVDAPASLILDKQGELLWYDTNTFRRLGFNLLSNGLMAWVEDNFFFLMDSNFQVIDTLQCQKGRLTDIHELVVDRQGHYFLLCTRDTTADLSGATTQTGAPGMVNGTVRYNLIQELDASGSLVKEWDPAPYFFPADVDSRYFTNASYMELMHTNSIDLDTNGQVLISSRHVNEVTSIDWASGNIRWRLGGAQNQFTFVNDPGLSGQHDARFRGNGRISVFDNGTYHNPPISRGVTYQLDTVNWTATPEWSYAHPAQVSTAMGSFQPFPNGDALICWGVGNPSPNINFTFVQADSTPLWNWTFIDNYKTYRVRNLDLPFQLERPGITCAPAPGGATLTATGNFASFLWSNGAAGPSIMVSDTVGTRCTPEWGSEGR